MAEAGPNPMRSFDLGVSARFYRVVADRHGDAFAVEEALVRSHSALLAAVHHV